jgi:hypothetical protein
MPWHAPTKGGSVASEKVDAVHGEKMIEAKVRFWTNGISGEPGKIVPKHAWSSGVVRMERNPSHGIEPQHPRIFHSLLDIGAVVEKVLIEHGVVLHPSRRMKRYIAGCEQPNE